LSEQPSRREMIAVAAAMLAPARAFADDLQRGDVDGRAGREMTGAASYFADVGSRTTRPAARIGSPTCIVFSNHHEG
jgi:hypothetical protein